MTEASVSFAGNLTDQPEVRYTDSGNRPGHVPSRRERSQGAGGVVLHRDRVAHASQSLTKGSRVVVVGRLQQRTWTAEDGSA